MTDLARQQGLEALKQIHVHLQGIADELKRLDWPQAATYVSVMSPFTERLLKQTTQALSSQPSFEGQPAQPAQTA